MIPKKIHYCWFGNNELSHEAKRCIDSWKRILPEYEIILWNEKSFDITQNNYVKQAYEKKKFAFVTDYVRLYALYHYGGIYMDSDVEILKPIDSFLNHRAFLGYERDGLLQTGFIAAERGHVWVSALLAAYNEKDFILPNGELDTTANTALVTKVTTELYGLIPSNEYQILEDDIHIYPVNYFCAKDWRTGELMVNEQTFSIHHFAASWIPEKEKKRIRRRVLIKKCIIRVLGKRGFEKLSELRKKLS